MKEDDHHWPLCPRCGCGLTSVDIDECGCCTQCRQQLSTKETENVAKIEMTYELAMAAGRDAGNRSMREGGRTKWAVKDWNAACETFDRLWPSPEKVATSNQHHQRKGGRSETHG